MRKFYSLERADVFVFTTTKQRRCVFTRAVPRHDRGFRETRNEKRARRVTLVMLEKVKLEITRAEVFANTARVTQHSEVTLADLRDATIHAGLEHVARDNARLQRLHRFVTQHPRLPVKTDMRDVTDADACFVEAILHRVVRKPAVMLAAGKALLLGGSHDFAVLYERGGGIAECC